MKNGKFRIKKRFKVLFVLIIAILVYLSISALYSRIFYRDVEKITVEEIKFKNDKLKISLNKANPNAILVDGEGRYYHKGLYLTDNKFKEIKYTSKGSAAWGCYMHSNLSKGQRRNGLDCSGFTTWALYNGGFDPGDIGAHGKSDDYDLNSLDKEKTLTKKLSLSGKIKAGDLLGEVTRTDGHSAMVVGIDKNYYYVAEELWEYPLGLNINKYKKETFHNHFETVNLMDSYYKKQGKYTDMWY